MDIKKLRHFVILAQVKNFSEAAIRLAITQPALSRSIQNLETSLDVPLFVRNSRMVELTAYGTHLLVHAQQAILNVENIKIEIERLSELKTGSLVIGSGPIAVDGVVSRTNIKFAKVYPHVHLSLVVDELVGLLARLVEGELALAIGDVRLIDDLSLFNTVHLRQSSAQILVRAGHPLSGKEQVTSEDLLEYCFATFNNAPAEIVSGFLGLNVDVYRRHLMYSSNDLSSILTQTKNSDSLAILFSCNGLEQVEIGALVALSYNAGVNKVHSQYAVISYKPRVLAPAASVYLGMIKSM